MFIRNVTLAVGVSLLASVTMFGQPGVGYIFQLPGQNGSTGTPIVGYPYAANPLTPTINTLGPNGTSQIVAKPDGSGYYVLGTTLQIANQGFTSFATVNGIGGTPTAVAVSPDGNYAVVGAGDVYVLSTSSNAILLDTTTSGTIVGIAISRDSQFAYVLSNAPFGSIVTQINLVTKAKAGTLPFQNGGATTIAFSPLGLLYVGAVNRIFEIDPNTLQVTPNGTMTPNATPGPLRFTPDGTTLYFVNTTSNITGGAIVQIALGTYAMASWPPSTGTPPTPLDDVIIAGNGRIFAISLAATTLYDVSTSPLSLSISSLSSALGAQVQSVLGAAVSNELPSSLYLYLLIGTGQDNLYRITLSNNQVSAQSSAAISGGILEFVGVPPNSGAGSFIQLNNNQTVAQGATSLPLVAQVLDVTGRPVFNLPVTFTTDPSNGVVINTPNVTTNANGFVQTTVTAPAAQGTFTITLTAGAANASYTINVPGKGGTGGTGPGGISQVTIVSGDGQLVRTNFATPGSCTVAATGKPSTVTGDPLTVKVTDINGVPLPNVSVSFSVTSGTGNVVTFNPCDGNTGIGVTDAQGLARSGFFATTPANGFDFETDTVVATTPYGAVSFTEIEYASNLIGSSAQAFPPTITLLTPTVDTSRTVTVPVGGVAQNAVTAQILANSVPQLNCPNFVPGYGCPIPGVAIRITNDADLLTPSPYASCQGPTASDQTGTAHCNVVASCGNVPGIYPVYFTIGDSISQQGTVIITQGSGQSLTLLSGNNQTGGAGGSLPLPLVATVVDGCGAPVTGALVTWKVTQGTATLTKVVSTSGSSGQVSAGLTLGATPGPVQVTVSLGTASVVNFTATIQVTISSMTITGGNNQTATVGAAFAQPLTVVVKDGNNNPVPGANVSFAVSSGSATINPTTAITDTQGRASTSATASANPGAIVVTASYLSVSASFSLTATAQGPTLTAANFQNAASFQAGLAVCGLATATGPGLAQGITGTVSGANFFGPLPYTLNGLSLSVNGVPAPIYQLSNTNGKQQVTFQVPCEITPSNSGTVVIQVNGTTTTVAGVTILQAQPGIFFYTGSDGNPYGQVIGDDGNYVTALNPAKRGHNYYLIATGLGQVTPATATDSAGINGQNVPLQVIVGVSNLGVPVFEQIYQPNQIGVYVIGFTIPLTNPTGALQPLALAVIANGQTIFANSVYLPAVQ